MASTQEKYIRASTASNLTISQDTAGEIDVIIAAGSALYGHRHRDLAVQAWRLRANTDMRGARVVAHGLVPTILRMSVMRRGARPCLQRAQAFDLALDTLKWWCMQTCPVCNGHGHPVIPGTPHINTARDCQHCAGTGIRPLRKYVRHPEIAQRVVDRLDALAGMVFADMARKLAAEMDF